jgi:hypothetical protein
LTSIAARFATSRTISPSWQRRRCVSAGDYGRIHCAHGRQRLAVDREPACSTSPARITGLSNCSTH